MGEIIGTHGCSSDRLMCVFVVLGWSAATYWVRVKWRRVIDLVSIVATTAAVSVVLNLPVHVSQRAHATRLSLRDVLRCRPVSSAAATSVTRAFCLSRDSVNYRQAARDAGHMYVCSQLLSRVVLIISVWQLFSAVLCHAYININTWAVYTSESEPAGLASQFLHAVFSVFFVSNYFIINMFALTNKISGLLHYHWATVSDQQTMASHFGFILMRRYCDIDRLNAWMYLSKTSQLFIAHVTDIFTVIGLKVKITDRIS